MLIFNLLREKLETQKLTKLPLPTKDRRMVTTEGGAGDSLDSGFSELWCRKIFSGEQTGHGMGHSLRAREVSLNIVLFLQSHARTAKADPAV